MPLPDVTGSQDWSSDPRKSGRRLKRVEDQVTPTNRALARRAADVNTLQAQVATLQAQVATQYAYRRVTSTTTMTLADGVVSADPTTGTFTVTLPNPATCRGQRFTVVQFNAGTVTVAGPFNGGPTLLLGGSGATVRAVSNGTIYEQI